MLNFFKSKIIKVSVITLAGIILASCLQSKTRTLKSPCVANEFQDIKEDIHNPCIKRNVNPDILYS